MKRGRAASPAGGSSGGYPQPAAAQPTDAAARRRAKEQQEKLQLSREGPMNADTKDFCGAFAALDLDNSWDFAAFKKGFSLNITSMSPEVVTFDLIGVDPPLANAFRRILIAEVATVAISRVSMYQNTGVIHDENLAHRLGLIPIKVDPDKLEWKPADSEFGEKNSIKFSLHAVCTGAKHTIYSRDLKWEPLSEAQEKEFKDCPPRPVDEDVLIAHLRSGQEIECECYCEKGVGKEHAKWSPVCTAYYRLMPAIDLTQDIVGEDAKSLVSSCPMGVFDIEDLAGGGKKAVVAKPRNCTTCRECLETFPGEEKGLKLGKIKNHYLFSVESTGSIPAPDLFKKALVKLRQKCETAKSVLSLRSN